MTHAPVLKPTDLTIPLRGFRLVASKRGKAENVVDLVEFDVPRRAELGAKDVLVQLLAAPINYADLLKTRGYYGSEVPAFPYNAGNEGLFMVLATGCDVCGLTPGDVVLPNSYMLGTWSSHLVLDVTDVTKLPSDIDVVAASMSRVNVCTAYRMLHDFVTPEEGNIVVQNGATSHVGQSVIQIARSMGIRTISLVRESTTASAKKFLEQLGCDAIIEVPEKDSFDLAVARKKLEGFPWYKSRKISLGLNCIGGPYFHAVNELVANGSHIVTYGGIHTRSIDPSIASLIFRDVKYVGFSAGIWMAKNRKTAAYTKMLSDIVRLIGSGNYYRPPFQCFPLRDFKTAFNEFHSSERLSVFPKRLIFTTGSTFTQNLPTLCRSLLIK